MVEEKLVFMNEKLKIGIIGTHEVGKTTLGHLLTGYLKAMDYSVNLVHESARLSPFGLLDKTTMESEVWIINQQINNELTTAKYSDILVCDRTAMDTLAYAKHIMENNKSNKDKEMYELLNRIVDSNIKTFDIFIYLPIGEKIIKRRKKEHDLKFREKIDSYLMEIIKEKGLDNVYKIKNKSAHGRVEEIINVCGLDKEAFKLVSSNENSFNNINNARQRIIGAR